MDQTHAETMRSLAARHAVLSDLIGTSPTCYVDVPVYGNIGDLLIMQGTLKFFESYAVDVRIKAAYFNFTSRWVRPGDVVVFQGGGNFGDLYGGLQRFRERIIRELPRNRIVILPQTLHFASPIAYEASCAALACHPDLHICVRDHRSLELAQAMSPNVYLLPDMAHQLWPMARASAPSAARLAVLRSDRESMQATVSEFDHLTDWPILVGWREQAIRVAHRVMQALHLTRVDRHLVNRELALWMRCAEGLVSEAVDLFSRFEAVTTDRLHGHILACLLGMPNRVLDNSYGKNSSYVNTWTRGSDLVELVEPTNARSRT